MAAFDLALSRLRQGADDFLLPARINQLARAQGHLFCHGARKTGSSALCVKPGGTGM